MSNDARLVSERGSGNLAVSPATAVNESVLFATEFSVIPSAPGVAMHAQYPAGAAINSVGPFTMQRPRRTCRIVLGVGGANPVVYTITGVDVYGRTLTDVINATGPGTYEGTIAFHSITSFASNIDPLGTTDLQTGKGFQCNLLPLTPYDGAIPQIYPTIGVDGVEEALASASVVHNTIVPTTAPNGARVFTYVVAWRNTITQTPHNHGLTLT